MVSEKYNGYVIDKSYDGYEMNPKGFWARRKFEDGSFDYFFDDQASSITKMKKKIDERTERDIIFGHYNILIYVHGILEPDEIRKLLKESKHAWKSGDLDSAISILQNLQDDPRIDSVCNRWIQSLLLHLRKQKSENIAGKLNSEQIR
jgi:hypothetical protein